MGPIAGSRSRASDVANKVSSGDLMPICCRVNMEVEHHDECSGVNCFRRLTVDSVKRSE